MHRARSFAVGFGLILAPVTENPWWTLALRAVGAGLVVLAVCKVRLRVVPSVLFALGCLGLAPSAMGEQNARPALLLLAGFAAFAVVTTLTGHAKKAAGSFWVVAPSALLAAYWLLVHLFADPPFSSALPSAQVFTAVAVVVLAVRTRPDLIVDALRLLVVATAVLAVLWWAATLARITAEPLIYVSTQTLDWRPEFLFHQSLDGWVLTGSPGFFGTSRSTMIAGEPGAWATWCVVAIGAAGVVFTGRARTVTIAALCAGVLASQSYGAVLLLIGVWVAHAFLRALHQGRLHPVAMLAGLAGLVGLLPLANYLIAAKASTNAASLTDRGLGTYGAASRINLLSTFSVDGMVTLIAAAAFVVAIVAARQPSIRVAALFLAFDGLLLQPATFHAGAFLVIAIASALPRLGVSEEVEHLDEQPERADQQS